MGESQSEVRCAWEEFYRRVNECKDLSSLEGTSQ